MFVLQEKETTVLCLFVKLFFCEKVKISEKSDTKECYQELKYVQPPLENNYKFVFVFQCAFSAGLSTGVFLPLLVGARRLLLR